MSQKKPKTFLLKVAPELWEKFQETVPHSTTLQKTLNEMIQGRVSK